MKFLLDTHIWIWAVESPDKLSRAVRRQLEAPKNELYLSPVSIWEASYLERRKRLKFHGTFLEWLDRVFTRVPLQEAAFNFNVAAEASRINLPQMDLGDLFLAATANVFGLTLITADSQLMEYRWLKTLANE